MKKRVLFDPHGGHSTAGHDDGKSTVSENVGAAVQKNIIPSITAHNETEGWEEYLQAMDSHGLSKYSIVGTEFGYVYKEKVDRGIQRYKGEIVCLMPAHEQLTLKMRTHIIAPWKRNKWFKEQSLAQLFDHVRSNLTEQEWNMLVWHLPHPVTIDAIPAGKVLARLWGKFDILSSPEIYIPEIAKYISTIEVYNAAHPGAINKLSVALARDTRLSHIGWAGASDSHHYSWLGSGATLLEVEEESADGILNAMRKGRTIAISGFGRDSDTYKPFFMWGLTIFFPNTPITNKISQYTAVNLAYKRFEERKFDDLLTESRTLGWLR